MGSASREDMTNRSALLIVDDDRAMREMVASVFAERGHDVELADSAAQALERIAEHEFDAVVSDVRMPGLSGIELLGRISALRPGLPVVLMTAFGSIESAVEAMRVGAFDYVAKPFEPDAIIFAVERALDHRRLRLENEALRRVVGPVASLEGIVGESPAMQEVFALVRRVAQTDSSVLIRGESGTGKDLVARAIHVLGRRAEAAFVPVNCTAIPEGLLESELFGHTKGAFTGAHTSRVGLFEKAHGGTLFLDEIGEHPHRRCSPSFCASLQESAASTAWAAPKTIEVDVRHRSRRRIAICAKEVAGGRFREDLFYRLNVIPVRIPPLRERPEDVAPLVEAFLRKHAGDQPRFVSPEALHRLRAHSWRGNARELENVIERALVLSDAETLEAGDIPLAESQEPPRDANRGALRHAALRGWSLEDLTDSYIEEVLALEQGNKVRAARRLGVDRKTLYRRAERRAASVRVGAAGSEDSTS